MAESYNYLEIPELTLSDIVTIEQVFVRTMFLHLVNDHNLSDMQAREALGITTEQRVHIMGLGDGT